MLSFTGSIAYWPNFRNDLLQRRLLNLLMWLKIWCLYGSSSIHIVSHKYCTLINLWYTLVLIFWGLLNKIKFLAPLGFYLKRVINLANNLAALQNWHQLTFNFSWLNISKRAYYHRVILAAFFWGSDLSLNTWGICNSKHHNGVEKTRVPIRAIFVEFTLITAVKWMV